MVSRARASALNHAPSTRKRSDAPRPRARASEAMRPAPCTPDGAQRRGPKPLAPLHPRPQASKRRKPRLPPERFRRSSAKPSSEDQRRRKRGLLPGVRPTRRTGCRRRSVPASNRRQRSLPWHPPRHAASPWRDSPHARSNSLAPARREALRPSDAPRRAP